MGTNTRTVGGGSSTRTANQFQNFLQGQLSGPTQSYSAAETMNAGGVQGIMNQMQQNQQMQNSPFMQAFNQMMSGGGDPSGGQAFVNNLMQQGSNFQNQYSSPEFQAANLQQLATNFGQGQTGMADLSQIGQVGPSQFNTAAGMGQMAQLGSGGAAQQQALSQLLSGGGGVNFNGNVGMAGPRTVDDIRNTELAGAFDFAEVMRQRAVADQRARFGAEGAGALGTGAQFAESTLNADLAARNAQNAFDMINRTQQVDLGNRSAAAQTALGNQGQNLQAALANAGNTLQGSQAAMNSFLQGRGQDLQNQLGNRGLDVNQLGLGLQQSLGNMNAGVNQRGQDINALINNQQLGNQFGLGAAQLNNNAMQTNNTNALNQSGMLNNFNLSNAGNMAQFGQAANALNANNNQALGQLGLSSNQQQFNNINQMLQNLFGGFQQATSIGTPQAQIVQEPSAAGQFLNAGLQLGGAFLGGPGGAALFGANQIANNVMPQGGFAPPQNVFQGANFNPFQPGGFSFNGGGGGSPFGIGNPGGMNMSMLDPRAIQADPQGFQQWLAQNPNMSMMR